MDPVSLSVMAGVGIASSALGSITGAIGANYQGEAQANAYNYQAGVAQLNKQIAEQNADYEGLAAGVQGQKYGLEAKARLGQIKAAQSAGNLDVNSGSAALIRKSQTAMSQQDEAQINANASRKAYGYEVEAMQDTAQSRLDTTAASTSRVAGDIGAIGSILGGVSSVSSKWLQYNSAFGKSGGGGGGTSSIFGA